VDRQRLRVPVNPDELSPKVSSWRTYYYLEFNEDNKIGIKVTPLDRGYIHRNGEPIKHDITMTGKRSIAVYAKENDVTGGGGKTVTIGEESVGIYLQAVKPTAIIRGNGWSSTNYSLITNQEFRYAGKNNKLFTKKPLLTSVTISFKDVYSIHSFYLLQYKMAIWWIN